MNVEEEENENMKEKENQRADPTRIIRNISFQGGGKFNKQFIIYIFYHLINQSFQQLH